MKLTLGGLISGRQRLRKTLRQRDDARLTLDLTFGTFWVVGDGVGTAVAAMQEDPRVAYVAMAPYEDDSGTLQWAYVGFDKDGRYVEGCIVNDVDRCPPNCPLGDIVDRIIAFLRAA